MVECRICDHEVAGLNLVVSLHQHQLDLPSHLWSVIEYQQKLGSKLAYHVTSLSLSYTCLNNLTIQSTGSLLLKHNALTSVGMFETCAW